MSNEQEKNSKYEEKNSERNYLNVILIFAAIQAVIAVLEFIQSSINSTTTLGKWFGVISSLVVASLMWYMYKVVKRK